MLQIYRYLLVRQYRSSLSPGLSPCSSTCLQCRIPVHWVQCDAHPGQHQPDWLSQEELFLRPRPGAENWCQRAEFSTWALHTVHSVLPFPRFCLLGNWSCCRLAQLPALLWLCTESAAAICAPPLSIAACAIAFACWLLTHWASRCCTSSTLHSWAGTSVVTLWQDPSPAAAL